MLTLLKIVGVLIAVAGTIAGVVSYVRRGLQNKVDLAETGAALQLEQQRRAALEAAEAEERHQRRIGFDAQVVNSRTAADAAKLLHDASGADDPDTN